MSAKLLELPVANVQDLPRGLRKLADDIEAAQYGDAHFLAWVIDCGDGKVMCGGLGQSPEAGAVAHLLFAMAQRKLEQL